MSILSYNKEEEIFISLKNIERAFQLLGQRLREFDDVWKEFSTAVKESYINDDCNM
jgi:nitrate reductase assembly molybdenum cofactor insertion protein NarJ